MERLDHVLQFGLATDLWEKLNEAVSADLIKRLNEINESDVQGHAVLCTSLVTVKGIVSIVDRSARKPHCESG